MNASNNPLLWSFPVGSLFATRIRISFYFPLLLLALCFRLDLQIAFALTIIFLFSTLLHELIGHVLVARMTEGDANEVLLWPFGGLAWVRPANTFQSQFFTAAGGPFINLLICLAMLPTVLSVENGTAAFNPFQLPFLTFSDQWLTGAGQILLLIFFVNWALALINLLPLYPLDGGRMVEACLRGYGSANERKLLCLKISMATGIILMMLGIYLDNVWVVVLSSTLMLLSILEGANLQWGGSDDDSFMGYDFSQGYTSLEQDEQGSQRAQKSYWARRQETKETEKQKHLEILKVEQEHKLDTLLAKVHESGIDSLNAGEKRFLQQTSKNYRNQ